MSMHLSGAAGLVLHLGEDVPHDRPACAVLCHVQQLRPAECVIEVVFQLVVLRQTLQVALLHSQQVLHASSPDVHHSARK